MGEGAARLLMCMGVGLPPNRLQLSVDSVFGLGSPIGVSPNAPAFLSGVKFFNAVNEVSERRREISPLSLSCRVPPVVTPPPSTLWRILVAVGPARA